MSRGVPSSRRSTARTSSRVRTTGKRCGRLARTISSIHGRSTARTSPYRKSRALNAWFCVDAATFPSTARELRKRVTSGRPHVGGVALVVEEDVAADPRDIGLLGAAAVMSGADGGADAVEQSWLERAGRVGFAYAKCESERG